MIKTTQTKLTVKSVIADVYTVKGTVKGKPAYIVVVLDTNGALVGTAIFNDADAAKSAVVLLEFVTNYKGTGGLANVHNHGGYDNLNKSIIDTYNADDETDADFDYTTEEVF